MLGYQMIERPKIVVVKKFLSILEFKAIRYLSVSLDRMPTLSQSQKSRPIKGAPNPHTYLPLG